MQNCVSFKIKRSVEGAARFGAPLGVTGLKCGSEERRAGEGTRPYTDTGTDPFFS